MRAPSLKSPDTFVIYIPYNNSVDGAPIWLLGGDYGSPLFDAGTVLTRIQIGGYTFTGGMFEVLNADAEAITSVLASTYGPLVIDYTPSTPINVGEADVMISLSPVGEATCEGVGGMLTFRKA